MGKGDQRTRRGKLYRGTFGKSRPHKAKKQTAAKPMSAVARAAARRQSRKAAAPSGE